MIRFMFRFQLSNYYYTFVLYRTVVSFVQLLVCTVSEVCKNLLFKRNCHSDLADSSQLFDDKGYFPQPLPCSATLSVSFAKSSDNLFGMISL